MTDHEQSMHCTCLVAVEHMVDVTVTEILARANFVTMASMQESSSNVVLSDSQSYIIKP